MRRLFITAACSCVGVFSFAQTVDSRRIYTNKEELEDIEMGWITPLKSTTAKAVVKNGWNYPADQINTAQTLGLWLQETFTLIGVLGEIRLSVLATEPSKYIGTTSYDMTEAEKDNRFALPNTYGAYAKFHQCLSKTAEKRFWPTNGNHCYTTLNIMANAVESITKQIVALSTATDFYCTMPMYAADQPGQYDKDWIKKITIYRNFSESSNLKPYMHYVNPGSNDMSYVVVMTPDGVPLPFEQVTVTNFIKQLEQQLPKLMQLAQNRKLIYANYQESARKAIPVLRELLKDHLNDYVYFNDFNRMLDIIDLADIGSSGKLPNWLSTQARSASNTNYPLLHLKRGIKEKAANGGVQWIVFKITAPINYAYGGSVRLMDDFVSRFNYAFAHQYFFGKQKPGGSYAVIPFVSNDDANTAKAPGKASEATIKNRDDKSVLFFEYFSTTAAGGVPVNWYTEKSADGNKPTVVEVDGAPGKWLKLKGKSYPVTAAPALTGDFVLSFDLLVQKGDVPWGTPGIAVQLSAEDGKHRLILDVSPGDMNRADAAGWVTVSRIAPSGYFTCKLENYYSIPFTGSKPVNTTSITLERKGEEIRVLCNGKLVYACEKAFPTGTAFKLAHLYVNQKNVYHVSNISLRKM